MVLVSANFSTDVTGQGRPARIEGVSVAACFVSCIKSGCLSKVVLLGTAVSAANTRKSRGCCPRVVLWEFAT